MYKTKFLAVVVLAILFGGVFISAEAQKRMSPTFFIDPPPTILSGDYSMNVDANELSAGDTDSIAGPTYGWTCYGTTEGDLSGFLFISMDYASDVLTPGSADRSGVKNVIGGSWSKLIFVDGVNTGSVHGRIVGGHLVVNNFDGTTSINLTLTAEDGTGDYTGSEGYGTFAGVLSQSAKARSVTGQLILNY
ncbi:MAG TPA: hypothetical protein VGO56_00395 [Pyrinomonadaceae bacterium]|jgi:hypothetical protein|nr:hypothetical protein [Pyrinomonadaceae bacterium]